MTNPDPAALPFIDNAIVDELRQVMGADFPDVVKNFLRDIAIRTAAIRTAAAQGDAAVLFDHAHQLKAVSGTMGAPRLSEWARRLEMHGRSGQLADIDPELEQLQLSAEQTRLVFEALLNG